MTAKIVKNLDVSIRARLLNHARQHGDDYQRVLTRYAIERLLYRLSKTEAAARYVLKCRATIKMRIRDEQDENRQRQRR